MKRHSLALFTVSELQLRELFLVDLVLAARQHARGRTLRALSVVTLREITDENRDAVLAVQVAPAQERFVGTVAGALRDAEEIPEGKPWYRAIYAHDEPVGFVMLSWNVTPEPPRIVGPWFLWKLLVDQRHQGRGYGRESVRLVADIVRANGATELLTSCVVGKGGPEPFYRRIGFSPTGELDENGEIILMLDLVPD
jgi:diamine N-acetyltransferase